ncbi:MAG: hypothetical protein Q7S68_04555 [Deltaproteobacteria bacterium]|nr:hypothetical protein [Deltaproteobacteria bacterium]
MAKILKTIPDDLEKRLFEEYTEIKRRHQLNDCGPSQLNGGRFAEAVLRIFQHLLGAAVTAFGEDIPATEKTKIINKVTSDSHIDEHIRQKVTALTKLLLDFRNNRDVAHLGGFSANKIDASFVLSCANWIVAELIRVYGNYSMDEAQEIIHKIAIPNYPVIFCVEEEEFIARDDLSVKQEVLILLSKQKRSSDFLFSKTKDRNRSRFNKTLASMTAKKFIALKDGFYHLLPNGIKEIQEKNILNYA